MIHAQHQQFLSINQLLSKKFSKKIKASGAARLKFCRKQNSGKQGNGLKKKKLLGVEITGCGVNVCITRSTDNKD
jgi:hypothetical protein